MLRSSVRLLQHRAQSERVAALPLFEAEEEMAGA